MRSNRAKRHPNALRICRKRSGLSQRELGDLLGYPNQSAVARHERRVVAPSLAIAIGYEVLYRTPITRLFSGLHGEVAHAVEAKLAELERLLGERSAKDRDAVITAQKLMWISERRNTGEFPSA